MAICVRYVSVQSYRLIISVSVRYIWRSLSFNLTALNVHRILIACFCVKIAHFKHSYALDANQMSRVFCQIVQPDANNF